VRAGQLWFMLKMTLEMVHMNVLTLYGAVLWCMTHSQKRLQILLLVDLLLPMTNFRQVVGKSCTYTSVSKRYDLLVLTKGQRCIGQVERN